MSINYSDSELKGKKIADLNLEDVSVTTALDAILNSIFLVLVNWLLFYDQLK